MVTLLLVSIGEFPINISIAEYSLFSPLLGFFCVSGSGYNKLVSEPATILGDMSHGAKTN